MTTGDQTLVLSQCEALEYMNDMGELTGEWVTNIVLPVTDNDTVLIQVEAFSKVDAQEVASKLTDLLRGRKGTIRINFY